MKSALQKEIVVSEYQSLRKCYFLFPSSNLLSWLDSTLVLRI